MQTIEFKAKSKLIISKEVLSQIAYLHNKIGDIEWSGLLFYKIISGDISEPATFVMKAERIYLMNIGSAAYTEFSPDESIVDFYEKYPESLTMKWGMIHTHHNMKTFFSGTDMDELRSNSGAHNFYLSLIVNYLDGGDYCAKIGIEAEAESKSKYKFTKGVSFKGMDDKEVSEKVLFTINCDIEYEISDFDIERYATIKKAKEVPKIKHHHVIDGFPHTGFYNSKYGKQAEFQFGEGFSAKNYIPKTPKEIERFLVKLISLNDHEERGLKDILDDLEKEAKKYAEQFDDVYWDTLSYNLNGAYWGLFEQYLPLEHESKFFQQCIMFLDKYRMSGYSFYDNMIDFFETYIEIEDIKEFEKESKKSKKKEFSFKNLLK